MTHLKRTETLHICHVRVALININNITDDCTVRFHVVKYYQIFAQKIKIGIDDCISG